MATNLFSLSGHSWKEVAARTWSEIREDDVFGRAAQLAYYFFLALFPFLICLIASLSIFGFADKGRELVFRFFSGALPPSAFELINTTITDIIHQSGPLKISFGIIGALWSASMGMSAVMDTLDAAYEVKETRPLWKQYAVATGLTLGITLLLVVSVIIVLAGDKIVHAISPGTIIEHAWKIAQWPLALALMLLAFAITYYFAPDLRNREWHWFSPGAIAGVALWVLVSVGLRIYLYFSGGYGALYGSLGAVIVLLLWFYLTGIAVLSGAELNGVLEHLTMSKQVQEQRKQVASAA
jgi:membrane protein